MNTDDPTGLSRQLRAEFEAFDERTRSSLDRLRSIMYRNKKELEQPIFQNKLRLTKLGKRSWWFVGLIVIQAVVIVIPRLELSRPQAQGNDFPDLRKQAFAVIGPGDRHAPGHIKDRVGLGQFDQ